MISLRLNEFVTAPIDVNTQHRTLHTETQVLTSLTVAASESLYK